MRNVTFALLTASALTLGAALGESPATAQAPAPAGGVHTMAVPSDAMLSYNLVGLNTVDGANNTVGEIKDLVIEKGALAGYVLSVGGFLGMGEHYVAVSPASVAVSWDSTANKWKAVVNATKDQLKAAPEFKYEGRWKKSA